MGPRAEATIRYGHDVSRRPSIVARDPHAYLRYVAHRTDICATARAPVFPGNVGRSDVRHVDALPQGIALGTTRRHARARAELAFSDVASLRQRGGLHELSRQRRPPVRARIGEGGDRSLPRF